MGGGGPGLGERRGCAGGVWATGGRGGGRGKGRPEAVEGAGGGVGELGGVDGLEAVVSHLDVCAYVCGKVAVVGFYWVPAATNAWFRVVTIVMAVRPLKVQLRQTISVKSVPCIR